MIYENYGFWRTHPHLVPELARAWQVSPDGKRVTLQLQRGDHTVQVRVPRGTVLVGIDENTAMVGDGAAWSVAGVGGVHVLDDGDWTHHGPGAAFDLPLLPR